jgi:hypothetical protein
MLLMVSHNERPVEELVGLRGFVNLSVTQAARNSVFGGAPLAWTEANGTRHGTEHGG